MNESEDEISDEADELESKEAGDDPGVPNVESLNEAGHPEWDMDPAACRRRVEAVMFLARDPLSSRKISQLAGLEDGTRARTLIKELNEHYDSVGRAFQIKRIAGGYQMLTRPGFARWIRRQEHVSGHRRLSGPMMETLAVVAYRQPIIKAEIEAIRGVSCGEILRQLLEKGLVKIAGRSPELGRPYLYATSRQFLAKFGLNSPEDLPRASHLAGIGLPQWAVSVNNSESSADLSSESDEERLDDPATAD